MPSQAGRLSLISILNANDLQVQVPPLSDLDHLFEIEEESFSEPIIGIVVDQHYL